jgi:hypothetical protein
MHGKHCLPGQLDLFDPMDLAETLAETVPDDHAVSAADLVNHAEEIAAVSGCRCRVCGHNARRDPGHSTWYVGHSTAYCAACWAER